MNFKMEKKELFPVLSQIQGILEKRSAFPVFSQILIKSKGAKKIQILASDSELSFSAKLPAELIQPGMMAVNGKRLFEIVRELSEGEFSIEELEGDRQRSEAQSQAQTSPQAEAEEKQQEKQQGDKQGEEEENSAQENTEESTELDTKAEAEEKSQDPTEAQAESAEGASQILLRQHKSRFEIHGTNPKDFPSFPPIAKKKKQAFLVKDFLNMIDKTLYCTALDESRYHLTGVFVERIKDQLIRFVATDGHRLSFVESKAENTEDLGHGIIIPKKGLQEIKKMLSHSQSEKDRLDFYIEKPRIAVQFQNQIISVRLIEGEYPNYKSLLEEQKREKHIYVSVKPFLDALRRISVLTSARFKGVNFTFKDNQIHMDFEHPDVGSAEEQVSCKYEGVKIKIRFNSRYIMDVLQSFDENQELRISLKNKSSSGIIQAKEDEDYTCLVMPMKI